MHSAIDHGFDCPVRGSLAMPYSWNVEIKLRGQWAPTDCWGHDRASLANDARFWATFYAPEHIRIVHKPR